MTRYSPYTWADDEAGETPITAARLNALEAGVDADVPVADLAATGTASSTTYLRGDGTWATPAGSGATDLEGLSDVDLTTPANRHVLRYESASSQWKNEANSVPISEVSATGTPSSTTYLRGDGTWATPSGGSPWNQTVNLTGSSFSSFTSTSGTWSSDGSVISQTDTSTSTAMRAHVTAPHMLAPIVFEAEVMITSTGSGSDRNIGLILGYDGAGSSGGILARINFNNAGTWKAEVEIDSNAARISKTITGPAVDTWIKLRLVFAGTVTIFVDGVDCGTAGAVAGLNNSAYLGLLTRGIHGKFRNLKAWSLTLPA